MRAMPGARSFIQRIGIRRFGRAATTTDRVRADKVVATYHLGRWEGARLDDRRIVAGEVGRVARTTQVKVGVVDAAVEDGDRDACPVEAEVLHGGGADVGHCLTQTHLVVSNLVDAPHIRVTGKIGETSG